LRKDMPKDLVVFARMSHGPGGHGTSAPAHATPGASPSAASDPHAGHRVSPDQPDGTTPVVSPVPIRMTSALNSHPYVSAIAMDRARAISTSAANEVVVLVAHGPVPDDDNVRWLKELAVIAGQVKASAPYAAVEYLTVRDDAPKPVRDAAAAQLRSVVERHDAEKRRVLIVPILLSFGGIEHGLRTRLEGLPYTMADRGLMPDPRIEAWIRAMVAGATSTK
jgi:hypothetical protein